MDYDFAPRWIIKALGILLIILLAVLIINQFNAMSGPRQTMSITAQGKVNGTPDIATVRIGVVTEGATAIDVKNKNNQKTNQLIDFIKKQDIDKQDIQTSEYYSSPKYNYVNGQSNMVGYSATQTITVKFHDIDKSQLQLEKTLDGAINNGANQIQGINFSFSNSDALKNEARKQAIEKAKQKAKDLARDAGLHLGRIINVVEITDASNQPYPVAMSYARAKTSTPPDIQPGVQEVIENITLIFEIY